jgi:hypothetical protein
MLNKLDIIIDTREQRPWSFPEESAKVARGTIGIGDYALRGDQHMFAVERKSLDDFVGSISSTWDQFRVRFQKMRAANWPSMVCIVEADFVHTCFVETTGGIEGPPHNHPRITPQFIRARIAELSYYGAGILFAGTPELASALCWRVLYERRCDLDGVESEIERI